MDFKKKFDYDDINNFLPDNLTIGKSEFYQNVTCDTNDYSNDKINFKTCAPKNCARYFTDKVISDDEANVLLEYIIHF